MLYVLRRNTPMKNGHAAYVARPGSRKAYTASLKRARVFQSVAAAKAEACGNETVETITLDGQRIMEF